MYFLILVGGELRHNLCKGQGTVCRGWLALSSTPPAHHNFPHFLPTPVAVPIYSINTTSMVTLCFPLPTTRDGAADCAGVKPLGSASGNPTLGHSCTLGVGLCPSFQAHGVCCWWLWSHAPASMEEAHIFRPAFSFQLHLHR